MRLPSKLSKIEDKKPQFIKKRKQVCLLSSEGITFRRLKCLM